MTTPCGCGGPRRPVAAHIDTGDLLSWDAGKRAQVLRFLALHDVPKDRFICGTTIYVRRHVDEDGELWLHTWRTVQDEYGNTQLCTNCPGCPMQERVVRRLITGGPRVHNAYYNDELLSELRWHNWLTTHRITTSTKRSTDD